ncbi:hypothetical protein BT93_A0556 [Corymbia citriodora subsp. variegata]|nr:hypothetical protein BT93_A0556 [Corymbia citriodora subsp. variegata]
MKAGVHELNRNRNDLLQNSTPPPTFPSLYLYPLWGSLYAFVPSRYNAALRIRHRSPSRQLAKEYSKSSPGKQRDLRFPKYAKRLSSILAKVGHGIAGELGFHLTYFIHPPMNSRRADSAPHQRLLRREKGKGIVTSEMEDLRVRDYQNRTCRRVQSMTA